MAVKSAVLAFVMLAGACPAVSAPASVLDQIRAHNTGLAAWWAGNAGWLIKADKLLIGIDPKQDYEDKVAKVRLGKG